jgi:cyclophilin family peptidyl-prolyl cis-trans isomerase
MIGKFIAKFFRGTGIGRSVSTSKKMIRRIAIEPLETRRLLAVTGSISGYAYLDSQDSSVMAAGDAGFAGLTVQLQSVSSQGSLSNVAGVPPAQTNSSGMYNFTGLAAGTYQIQIQPSSKISVGPLSPGSAGGTVGTDEIQMTLAAGQSATDYNFAILGAQTNEISLRMFLSSTGSLTQFLTSMHTPPSVTAGDPGSSGVTATYSTGGSGVAAVPNATITSPDSPTLAWMTVTIQDPQNGSSELLSADTAGTTLTPSYTGGVLTITGVADVATYQTVLQSVQYSITALPADSGNRTLSIVVNDGTDSSTPATGAVSVEQGTGPSGYTIAADTSLINASAAASTGFTFSNALVGTTYSYTVTSSGGGTDVTGSGTVTATAQDVTGINVASLSNGTLTYSVTLTDSAGHAGAAATATTTLETTVPSGYTITANQSVIGAGAATSTGFTFSTAQVGATYNYTVHSSGGGTAVTGSGTVTSINESVTGINVSSLGSGTLTFSVTLTDTSGNVGAPATATATLDLTLPSGYTITANKAAVNATTGADTGFTFAGAATGSTYNYTVISSGGGTAVSGSGSVTSATEDVTGINVTSLDDGTLTYSVTLTDAAGNAGAAATASSILDRVAPSGYTIAANQAVVNIAASTDTGFTFAGAEVGTTYNYTVTSSGNSGATSISGSGSVTAAAQQVAGVNVSSLPDGTLTFSVTLTDEAGNVGKSVSAAATLNTAAPSGYTIAADLTSINASHAAASGFTFAGATTGTTYSYTVTSSGNSGATSVTGSGSVTSPTQDVTGINVSALPDGTLTYSVKLTNSSGNASPAATATATLITAAPVGYSIAAVPAALNATTAADAGFQFSGAQTGTTYSYNISSGSLSPVSGSGSVTSATESVTGINLTSFGSGNLTLTYSVTLTNTAGNTGAAATTTGVLDRVAPSGYTIAAVPASLNSGNDTAAGFTFTAADVGTTYNYTVTSNGSGGVASVSGSGSVTSAAQQVTGINVSALANGALTFSVKLTDAAGNVGAAATAAATLNTTVPAGYTIVAAPVVINGSLDTAAGFTLADATTGTTYVYTATGANGASVTGSGSVTSSTQQITGVNVSSLPNGTVTWSVDLVNAAGNSGPAATTTATLDKTPPSGYTIAAVPAALSATTDADAGFQFSGAETGTTYSYSIGSGALTPVTGSGSVTAATQTVSDINLSSLGSGNLTLTYSVTLTDAAGNVGAPATTTVVLDRVGPSGYSITPDQTLLNSTTAPSAGFTLAGGATGSTYQYTISSNVGTGTVTGSGSVTAASQNITGINVSALSDGTLTYSVTLTDAAGNKGAAATNTAVLDKTSPAGYTIVAVPATLNASDATAAGFQFTAAETGMTYNYSIGSSGGGLAVIGSGSVTSATQSVTGINVSGLSNGTLTYSVTLTDSAGHIGAAATASAVLERGAPTGYTITANQPVIDATTSTDTGFTFANAQTGTSYVYTVTSSVGAGSVSGTGNVTAAAQQVTGINVSSLADGTLTFSVTLTNTAGLTGTAATATAKLDTVPPTGYTITANQSLLNSSSASAAGFTLAGASTGGKYSYTVSSNGGSGTATGSGSVTATGQSVAPINVSTLPDGTLTYSVTFTDADGNTGAAATATAVLDQHGPAGYQIDAVPAVLNATAAAAAGFQFIAAEPSMAYAFSIASSGGGTPVTGSGNVTSATQSVTGINLSALPSGTLTYSVTLTDTNGHVGPAATASALLELTAPAGYTIVANPTTISNSSSTDAGFTFTGAETNATYKYSVASSGGGAAVTGSGAVTSATQQVTGINVSSLSSGTLTFSVTLTDQAGNVGAAATASATLVLLAVTSTPATTATVGQQYTYTVQTNAPVSDTIVVAAASGATLPTGMTLAGNTLTWTPAAAQAGTSPSFTLTVTDSTTGSSTTLGPVYVAVAAANGLTVIAPPADIAIGAPVLVAVDSANTATPTFSVTTSNSALTATFMPQTNQVLQIVTSLGDMDFQLLNNYTPNTVAHFVNLVNSDLYTNTSFYRIIQNFMDQGGVGSSYTGTPISTIPDELNPDLRFTSSGLLSMANDGVDGNSSEFFITNPDDMSDGFLDFRYTVFGKLISGDNVRQAIAATPVTTNSSGEDSLPLTAPVIESMSIITQTSDDVLMLSAATGASGTYTVTVKDGTGATQSFTITIGADSYDPPNPWVQPINGTDQINVAANGSATFTPQGESADGTAVQVAAQLFLPVPSYPMYLVDSSYTGTNPPADTTNPYMTLTSSVVSDVTTYTVTPETGYYGVQVLEVTGQSATAASWDSGAGVDPVYRAYVPVWVAPPTPQIASIAADGQTVSGSTSADNASSGSELTFNITGAIAGATVSVFVDGGATPIATGTVATGDTTITLTSSGDAKLSAGSHEFTVQQTIATTQIVLLADWTTTSTGSPSPGVEFPIPASSINSAASAGTALTIVLPAPPSGYSIVPDQTTLTSAGQAASTGFTFAGATTGTTYSFTVTSSGGAGSVTGSGSVTSPTQDVSGINVTSLPDGKLTYSVTLTDADGDVGTAVTASVTLDI